jgi:mono/diheme cytochrome c family protein
MKPAMYRLSKVIALSLVVGLGVIAGAKGWPEAAARPATPEKTTPEKTPFVAARTPEEAGRYLIRASGCNDCHTPGFMQHGETVPEALWLTGVPVGWRGPWGTTYASNLRRFVQPFTAEQFVYLVRNRNSRPPMVWPSLHAMSDPDLKAIYAYIKSLPVTGAVMPDVVPPDREPKTPYIMLVPQGLPSAPAQAAPTAPSARR